MGLLSDAIQHARKELHDLLGLNGNSPLGFTPGEGPRTLLDGLLPDPGETPGAAEIAPPSDLRVGEPAPAPPQPVPPQPAPPQSQPGATTPPPVPPQSPPLQSTPGNPLNNPGVTLPFPPGENPPPGHVKQLLQDLTGLPRNIVNQLVNNDPQPRPRSDGPTTAQAQQAGGTQVAQAGAGQAAQQVNANQAAAALQQTVAAAREALQNQLNAQNTAQPRNPAANPNAAALPSQVLVGLATPNAQQTLLAQQAQIPGNPAAVRPETLVPQTMNPQAAQPQGALRANEQAVPLPPRNELAQQPPAQQPPPRTDQPGLLQRLAAMLQLGSTAPIALTQAPTVMPAPRGAEIAAGLTMAVAPTASERPQDARMLQLPANDRARAPQHDAPLLPVYTAEGMMRRPLGRRPKVLPATLTRWLWALGLAGGEVRARAPDPEKDIFRALQWLFWLLAITAYGCLGFALLMLLPAGDSVPRLEAAEATGGAVLAIGLVAAGAAWWLARQTQKA